MNIFEQYGIKEVADVCLYSIELDENDDEVYIPVLYLDTLKVSTVEQTASQTSARGGLGNPELIIWDYGKEITVTLEDALYNPASMGMTWGGKYGTKTLELYGQIEVKETNNLTENVTVATPGKLIIENFSDYKKEGTTLKWTSNVKVISSDSKTRYSGKCDIGYNIINQKFGGISDNSVDATTSIKLTNISQPTNKNKKIYVSFIVSEGIENSRILKKNTVSPQEVIYQIDHALNNVKYLERIEKCKATQTFVIDTDINTTHGNYRYLEKYSQCELTVFIDPRTMQPYEPNTNKFVRKNGEVIEDKNLRIIKQHEIYYKWTRTKAIDYTTLGHQIIVDAIHFPGTYRLVGETYSRSRKTGKDERFQFEIPLCKMGSENNLTLQADGDPTTFSMTLKVLRREDGVMMKLTQYDVENEQYDGYNSDSTKVIPEDVVNNEDEDEHQITYKEVLVSESSDAVAYNIESSSEYTVGDTIIYSNDDSSESSNIKLKKNTTIVQTYYLKICIDGIETDEYVLDENGNKKTVVKTIETEEYCGDDYKLNISKIQEGESE